jgi:hypothetical protein
MKGTPMKLFRLAILVPLVVSLSSAWGQNQTLTKDQMKDFLTRAKIVSSRQSEKGITHPYRLTLKDDIVTHDGSFQSVDEHAASRKFEDGHVEMNFVDSYKYNLAAYVLAELLGIDEIMPVYVERKWMGMSGSLSWWLPVKMDEGERLSKRIGVPDSDAWNKQMYRIRVFDQLIYDTDPNLTNVLIGDDWQVWRVDFTRSFRLFKDLQNPKDLIQCDRNLFAKLKALDAKELTQKTKGYLTVSEVQALMARRDKIVTIFQKMITEKGESSILY